MCRWSCSKEESIPILTICQVEEDVSEIRTAPSNPDVDLERSKEPSSMIDNSPIEPRTPLELMDTESLDLIDENLLKDSRAMATGFIGKYH